MTLAAQVFVSVVPIMIVASAIRPDTHSLGASMGDAMGLSDEVQATLAGSIRRSATVASGVGFFGFLVAFFGATSYSRALERMYLKVWDVPEAPAAHRVAVGRDDRRGPGRDRGARAHRVHPADRPIGNALEAPIRFAVWTVVWTYVPWVLMRTEISLRALAFTGATSRSRSRSSPASAPSTCRSCSPPAPRSSVCSGLVFAYIGWLFVLSFAIVGATVVGAGLRPGRGDPRAARARAVAGGRQRAEPQRRRVAALGRDHVARRARAPGSSAR